MSGAFPPPAGESELTKLLRDLIAQHFHTMNQTLLGVTVEIGGMREKVGELAGTVAALGDQVGVLTLRMDNSTLKAIAAGEVRVEGNGGSEETKDRKAVERVLSLVTGKLLKTPMRAAATFVLTLAFGGGTMVAARGCVGVTAGTAATSAHATPTPGAARVTTP